MNIELNKVYDNYYNVVLNNCINIGTITTKYNNYKDEDCVEDFINYMISTDLSCNSETILQNEYQYFYKSSCSYTFKKYSQVIDELGNLSQKLYPEFNDNSILLETIYSQSEKDNINFYEKINEEYLSQIYERAVNRNESLNNKLRTIVDTFNLLNVCGIDEYYDLINFNSVFDYNSHDLGFDIPSHGDNASCKILSLRMDKLRNDIKNL